VGSDSADHQKETVRLLRQAVEELQKSRKAREAFAKSTEHFDMRQLRKKAEERRQEDVEYRNRLLGTLDRLIEVLSRIEGRLSGGAEKDSGS
jgi:FtsZ-binding cell division protein ZapB